MNIGTRLSLPHQTCLHFDADSKGLFLYPTLTRQKPWRRASMLRLEACWDLCLGSKHSLIDLRCLCSRDLPFNVCDQKQSTGLSKSVRVNKS